MTALRRRKGQKHYNNTGSSTGTPKRGDQHNFKALANDAHHHAGMKSMVVELTAASIQIKQIMLDLYHSQLVRQNIGDARANPYYAKVVVANLITDSQIKERHRSKHGFTSYNIEKVKGAINAFRFKFRQEHPELSMMDQYVAMNDAVQLVLQEILHNDHFVFELMTELMMKVGLGVDSAAMEVEKVLSGMKPSYLQDDE